MENRKFTYVGLIDFVNKENSDVYNDYRGQLSYCDEMITVEYKNIVQRLTTEIDISACNNKEINYRLRAIWDTGSMISGISEEYVEKMKLSPIDTGTVVTPTGQKECLYYLVDIRLPNDVIIKGIKIMSIPLKRHDCDFLIGMDIISKGNLSINNENGRTIIKFELTNNIT